ncbi:MAG: HAD-IA family hydrolase [Gemmataceae bacterium]
MAIDVDAVVFDAVGTLLLVEPPAGEVYYEVGKRHGSKLPRAEVVRRFAEVFAAEEEHDRVGGLRTSEERELERWRNIVAHVLDDVADPAACFEEMFRHFALPGAWRVPAGAACLLAKLDRLGYRLALASNFDSRLRSVVAGLPELAVLDRLVISSEIGWRKPAPEFFAELSRLLATPACRILLVGDDPVNDFEGAVRAGLQALLLDPAGGNGPGRLAHLDDLPGRLAR